MKGTQAICFPECKSSMKIWFSFKNPETKTPPILQTPASLDVAEVAPFQKSLFKSN